MEIFNHPYCTHVLAPPKNMQNDCSPLPVAEIESEDGIWTASFWKPSPQELSSLLSNGCVVLLVRARGRQHPVVSLTVDV